MHPSADDFDPDAHRPPTVCLGIDAEVIIRPELDAPLLRHCLRLLHHDLPTLRAPPKLTELATPSGDPLALRSLVKALRLDCAADAATAAAKRATTCAASIAPKSPSASFPVLIHRIPHTCAVDTDADLPTLWHQWAAASRADQRRLFEHLLKAHATSGFAAFIQAPIVTKELYETVLHLRLGAIDANDLTQSLQPFLMVLTLGPLATTARARTERYNLM